MTYITEGGTQFMIPLLILFFLTLFLIAKSFKVNSDKNRELIKSVSLFALVFGFAMIWHIWWLACVGILGIFVAFIHR